MIVPLERKFIYLVKNYKVEVKGAMDNLQKWTVRVKILISKGYRRKSNMYNTM